MSSNYDQLNSIQHKTLATVSNFTGPLSIVGSTAIIFVILSDRKNKLSKVYHRILLVMSCMDILQSTAQSLSTAPIPKGTPGVYGAAGTAETCNAQGFLLLCGYATPLYNGSLCLYYLLTIRYGVKEGTMQRQVEPFMHFISMMLPISLAVTAICYNVFGSNGSTCFLNQYKQDQACNNSDNDFDCVATPSAHKIISSCLAAIIMFLFAFVPLSMLGVYCTIRKQEVTMDTRYGHSKRHPTPSYSRRGGVILATGSEPPEESNKKRRFSSLLSSTVALRVKSPRGNSMMTKRTKDVAFQGFLYVLAFYITFVWPTLDVILVNATGRNNVYIAFLSRIFFPLQGFFNFFVFIRPRALRIRRQNPQFWYHRVIATAMFQTNIAEEEQERRNSIPRRASCCNERNSLIKECFPNIQQRELPPHHRDSLNFAYNPEVNAIAENMKKTMNPELSHDQEKGNLGDDIATALAELEAFGELKEDDQTSSIEHDGEESILPLTRTESASIPCFNATTSSDLPKKFTTTEENHDTIIMRGPLSLESQLCSNNINLSVNALEFGKIISSHSCEVALPTKP